MSNRLSEEQWRVVLDLAHAAAELPEQKRLAFLESTASSPEIVQRVLALMDDFDPPSDPSTLIGTRIEHFTLTRHLGRGGMGDVYCAVDTELHRTVAMKFLSPDATGLAGAMERFIREARTASALNHPNIVTIYEVIRSESSIAIVMEFVEGMTLRHLCSDAVPLQQFLAMGEQIAQALAAAHATGIVHRDIKPENIIVRPDGRVKVMDFGLARWVASDQQNNSLNFSSVPGMAAGTWRYMSPEQCRGEAMTGATDVFSFGLVLYELCTGRHPFAKASAFDTLQAINSEEPLPPSKYNAQIPPALDSLILAMLSKDPAARPDVITVGRTLAGLQAPEEMPVSAPAVSPIRGFFKGRGWISTSAKLLLAGLAIWAWRVVTIPTGQPEFRQVTTLVPENRATAAAISPNGNLTAYANVDGIFVRSILSGETNSLHAPDDFIVTKLAWFPDGTKLVASGFSPTTNQLSIWTIPVTGSQSRLLRKDAEDGVPSPDGTRLAYLSPESSEIWIMGASGEAPRQVLAGNTGDTFPFVGWSGDAHRLFFQRKHRSTRSDRDYVLSYESVDAETGKTLATVPDFGMDSAVALKDGRILFLPIDARSGYPANELWEARTDPATGSFRTSPHRVVGDKNIDHIYGLTSTEDGREAMVLMRSEQMTVFVADYQSSPPKIDHMRRLILDERTNNPHAWTADSSAVIFESNRNGNFDIFKQRIDQRTPELLVSSPSDEILPQLGPDGKTLLFEIIPPGVGIRAAHSGSNEPPPVGDGKLDRVPVSGGTAEEVHLNAPLDEFRCALTPGRRCVLRSSTGHEPFVFYDLDPVRGPGRELARVPWQPHILGDWDVSPDGTLVAIPNHDSPVGRVRVIPLDGSEQHEVVVSDLPTIHGVVWTSDGSGWFVSVGFPGGKRMVYVRSDGRVTPLGNIYGWAVPSPDGRHIAFVDRLGPTNAWMVALP